MKAFVLTIKDIEQSQQAADRCIKSGKTHGIDVQKHNIDVHCLFKASFHQLFLESAELFNARNLKNNVSV